MGRVDLIMLGSGIIGKAQAVYTGIMATVSGLTRVKLVHRITVVLGLVSDIIISVLQSAATMNPATWIMQTGMVFLDINGRLISNIATLEAGVPTWRGIQITVAIWGYLFVIYFAIKFFAKIAEETFAGDNKPTLPEYAFIAVFVLAPVQMVAGLIAKGFNGENLVLTKEVIPYSGVYEVFTHSSLWIEPVRQIAPNIGGVLGLGNEAENATKVIS